MSHVVIPYANTNDEKIIVVHVTELDGAGRAGSYRVEAEGPDTFTQGGGIVDSPCDYYNDIFYPLTDTVSHRNFRRNYCGNTISYDPGPSGH